MNTKIDKLFDMVCNLINSMKEGTPKEGKSKEGNLNTELEI